MHTRRILSGLLLLAGTIFFTACGNTASQDGEGQQEDMAQFADDPDFKSQHDGPTDARSAGEGEMIRFATPDGKEGSAYALTTDNSNKYLLVIHEWWGLNENIKREAEHYFRSLENVNVMAVDLYDGKVATNPDQAGEYMQQVSEDRARAILEGAMNRAGGSAEIATIGWCFGGGWSLKASIMAGDRAAGCVMYYGMPVESADKLSRIETDILGIFARQDQWITPAVVDKFQELAREAEVDLEVHQFDADHAFANPSNPNYKEKAAQEANQLSLDYLKSKLS